MNKTDPSGKIAGVDDLVILSAAGLVAAVVVADHYWNHTESGRQAQEAIKDGIDDATAQVGAVIGDIAKAVAADPNAQDKKRQAEQKERRDQRREDESRQGPDGNGQKLSGEGKRYEGRQNAKKGPSGDRPKGPDKSDGRERNVGIDEEHSIKPKGQQGQRG